MIRSVRLLASFVAIPLALVAGCAGGNPSATATPTAMDKLKASGETMRQESAFHFDLQYDGQRGTPILAGMELVSATGDFSSGDVQMTAGVRLTQLNAFVAQKVVAKGGETYLSDPITGRWSKAPPDQVPCALSDMNARLADLTLQAQTASFSGEETLTGRATQKIKATFPAQSFAPVVCGKAESGAVQTEVWLDKQSGHILKVRLEGRINPDEPEGLVRTLTFSQFGQAVDIQAPSL